MPNSARRNRARSGFRPGCGGKWPGFPWRWKSSAHRRTRDKDPCRAWCRRCARRPSHWSVKSLTKRCDLGSRSRRSVCSRRIFESVNLPCRASDKSSSSGVESQRKYDSREARAKSFSGPGCSKSGRGNPARSSSRSTSPNSAARSGDRRRAALKLADRLGQFQRPSDRGGNSCGPTR